VVTIMRTYPFVRVSNAGCSTGEEIYSIAILLHEEGLYDGTRIYATDINGGLQRPGEDGQPRRSQDGRVRRELRAIG